MELKRLRNKSNLTQRQVAEAVGIGLQAYSYYEKGERQPQFQTLCKLADFFDVTVDELLGRTTEPQLFDNARVERPEILELYESLTPELQQHALAYLHGLADRAAVQSSANVNLVLSNNQKKQN